MIYLCKKEYKFLAEWKLYDKDNGAVNNSTSANISKTSHQIGYDPSSN